MDDNNKNNEKDDYFSEDSVDDFDENGFDPTKEAFFSDLMEVEEEIASEGYELVEHAISLIDSRYFDDAIEVLRQAIGVYTQINRNAEIEAINQKISEIYMLKEQEFRESKDQIEATSETLEGQKVAVPKEVEKEKIEVQQEKIDKNLADSAKELIEQANQLIEIEEFDEAIDKYDEAIKINEELKNTSEIDKIYKFLEDCYNKKAIFLRKARKEAEIDEIVNETEQIEKQSEKEARAQRIRDYETEKKHEHDLSDKAYDLMGKGTDLANKKDYNLAIKSYEEAAEIFKELKWDYERQKVMETIETFKKEQEEFIILREKLKAQEESKTVPALQEPELLDDDIEKIRALEVEAAEKRRKELEKQKEDDASFEKLISSLVDKAEKIARDYESAMRVAIREGILVENCPYPEVIDIYTEIREKLIERGWRKHLEPYNNQIKIYHGKLEKDKKLRQVEAQKAQKQKELEEVLKVKEEDSQVDEIAKIQELEKQKEEDTNFEKQISTLVDKAENLARDYESAIKIAIREGDVLPACPYLEVIDIYTEIREKLIEKGWTKNLDPYNNQIKIYHGKLEKDKKLREVEVQKAERQKELEEMHKVKEEEPQVGEIEKIKELEEKKEEEAKFEEEISSLVDKAENLAKNYDKALKNAIRKGSDLPTCPYPEVIDIYKEIKEKLVDKGWTKNLEPYNNQIKIYHEKLEKDKKLRVVEEQKARRQKALEDMHKIKEVEPQANALAKEKELEKQELVDKEKNIDWQIDEMIEKIQRIDREYTSSIKKGKFITCPYPEIIDIYEQIIFILKDNNRMQEAIAYKNSIKLYKEKLEKDNKLREIEAQKAEKALEVIQPQASRQKTDDIKRQKMQELEEKKKEEENMLNVAMTLIDDAEKFVKKYEMALKTDILNQISPYESAISAYKEARKIFQQIGWVDEANRLIETIKFYKDKKAKDDKLRALERKKMEEVEIKPVIVEEVKPREEDLERKRQAIELKKERLEQDKIRDIALKMIDDAENLAKDYEQNIMHGILNFKCPYEEIIEIYREARKKFEEIGWNEEANKLLNSIKFYKEKSENDKKLRALEIKKVEEQEQELKKQKAFEKEMKEQEAELLKQKKEALELEREQKKSFETLRDKAFLLMDRAKRELIQENFDEAIQLYGESEKIFKDIDWQEGINMVKDSIVVISKKRETILEKRKKEEEERAKQLEIESQLEEKLAKIQETSAQEKEQKRKELIERQERKKQEKKLSEKAYNLLEQGTRLLDSKNFEEAQDKYITARDLFEKIEWNREVSRINNELLLKVKREESIHMKLISLRKQKAEERKEFEGLLKEAETRPKEEKKKEKFEEIDKNIIINLDKASLLIDALKYNEAILVLRELIKVLEQVGRSEEIKKINAQISSLISDSKVPIITLEDLGEDEKLEQFTLAYRALDKAIMSLSSNRFMKAVSELNEASFNLKSFTEGKKFTRELESKIEKYRNKLGGRVRAAAPVETIIKKETLSDDEEERLKARIAARRAERAKRVAELLKSKRSE